MTDKTKHLTVFFEEQEEHLPISGGETLSRLLLDHGYPLAMPCGGRGTCGKCFVRVQGHFSPPEEEEARFLGREALERGIRLACRCRVLEQGGTLWLEAPGPPPSSTPASPGKNLSEPPPPGPYGAVFDVGTTTLGCFLHSLATREPAGFAFAPTPQISRGADLLSRLTLAGESPQERVALQNMLLEHLHDLLYRLLLQRDIAPEDCRELLCLGNSGMHHLLHGLPPGPLLQAPFLPLLRDGLEEAPGGPLGTAICPGARLRSLPLIGGFVGSDFLGALYSLRERPFAKPRILVDLGTNGEIGLLWKGRILAASAAAGPAFEGGHISRGTCAREGAVSEVRITGTELALKTLGNAPPLGICGSGLADLLEVLLKGRGMDSRGRLQTPERVLHPAVRRGMRESEQGRSFCFGFSKEGESLELTQQDIREFQLAKGALRGGMELLLEEAGLRWEDVEEILLAGTFGTFLREEAALETGLFPRSMEGRVVPLGNAAARGGALVLLGGQKAMEEIRELRDRVEHRSLDSFPRFQELFLKALNFRS